MDTSAKADAFCMVCFLVLGWWYLHYIEWTIIKTKSSSFIENEASLKEGKDEQDISTEQKVHFITFYIMKNNPTIFCLYVIPHYLVFCYSFCKC